VRRDEAALRLSGRGVLAVGAFVDFCVSDANRIIDAPSFGEPTCLPQDWLAGSPQNGPAGA
jgi:hypothetical protein